MLFLIGLARGVTSATPQQQEFADTFRQAGLPVPTFFQGEREPAAHWQRSREITFAKSTRPFFDWYYIYVRDVKEKRAWAWTYAMSRCGRQKDGAKSSDGCKYEGAWPGFVTMEPGQAAQSYMERHGLKAWTASGATQSAQILSSGGTTNATIEGDGGNGSVVRLSGVLGTGSAAWRNEGGLGDSPISWDLRVSRRAGWFGESWIEQPFELGEKTGAIMWSPYGHMSTVEGHVTVRGRTFRLGGDKGRFRAYCDSNWGSAMPQPPPGGNPIDYPWGWYYAARPSVDPELDVSIICGVGRTWLGELTGSLYGKLCDLRIGSALRLSLWSWSFDRLGGKTASWASDSTSDSSGLQGVESFEIVRDNWTDWTDAYGAARVPMAQRLTITTRQHVISLAFRATRNATSRLVFPLENDLFSDFEALGAHATVEVRERAGDRAGRVVTSFVDDMGGLEFGYRVGTRGAESSLAERLA
jgi:hypothetical protein